MADDRRRRPVVSSGRRMTEKEKEEYRKRQRRIEKRREEIEKEGRSRRSVDSERQRRINKEKQKRSSSDSKVPNDDRRRRVAYETQSNKEGRKPVDRRAIEKNKKTKNKQKRKKIIKRVILGLVLVLGLFIGYTIYSVAGLVSKVTDNNMIKPNPVPMNKTVNILLLGLDVGDVNHPEIEANKRTDTIMVINYNPTTKKMHVVSIPRDTMIDINGKRWKINAAYPIGGDARVIEEVEDLLDIKINYLAKVNYKGFREFIDAIGGVDMYIEHDMHYTDKSQKLKIDFDKGTTPHLNGEDAEKFFRWRKNDDGTGLPNGDLDRIKNQHKFIEEVVKKCTSPTMLFKIPKVLDVVGNNIETNISGDALLKYGFKFIGLKSGDIIMTTLKGTPQMIEGQSYVVADKSANSDLIKALNSSDTSLDKVSREDVKIRILNGTKIGGLAASYQLELNQKGYETITTGNGELTNDTYIMVNDPNIKDMIKKDLPKFSNFKKLDESKYPGANVVIVLGSDAKTS